MTQAQFTIKSLSQYSVTTGEKSLHLLSTQMAQARVHRLLASRLHVIPVWFGGSPL
ncbi:uncharacterized, partial [Tachysurus ichikawai]